MKGQSSPKIWHFSEGFENADALKAALGRDTLVLARVSTKEFFDIEVPSHVTEVHIWLRRNKHEDNVVDAYFVANQLAALGKRAFVQRPDHEHEDFLAESVASTGYCPFVSAMTDFGEPVADVSIIPLKHAGIELPNFPVQSLPKILSTWVDDVSKRMGVETEYVVVSILAVISSVLGRKLRIRPKQKDSWAIVPNLWAMLVGRPGLMKTPAMDSALWFLARLEKEENERVASLVVRHSSELAEIDFKKADLELLLNNKKKTTAEKLELNQQISELNARRDALVPREKRFSTNDATHEKIAEILSYSPNGILIIRDELSGLFDSFQRAGREGEKQFYLQAWNGDSSHRIDRIQRGSIFVEALCAGIIGTIQPNVLSLKMKQGHNAGLADDGFVQRMQLAVFPDVRIGDAYVDDSPDEETQAQLLKLLNRMNSFDPQSDSQGLKINFQDGLAHIRFEPDAQKVFREFSIELSSRLNSIDGGSEALAGHLSKYPKLMPSLALIFHMVLYFSGESKKTEVSLEAAQSAVAITETLLLHAKKIYALGSQTNSTLDSFLAKIRSGDIRGEFTISELAKRGLSGLTNRDLIKAVIETLVEHRYLFKLPREQSTIGGRPTDYFIVHPELVGRTDEK